MESIFISVDKDAINSRHIKAREGSHLNAQPEQKSSHETKSISAR